MMTIFFWIIQHLPAAFWLFLTAAGVAGYFAASVISRFPPLTAYSAFIKPVSVFVTVIGIFMYGGAVLNQHYQDLINEMQQKVAVAEEKSNTVNTVVDTQIKTKIKTIRDTQVVYRDKIVEVATEIDKVCKLDPKVSEIHNDAAKDPFMSLSTAIEKHNQLVEKVK